MKLVPLFSVSPHAREELDENGVSLARQVFHMPEDQCQDIRKVPCPHDPAHPLGHVRRAALIHILVPKEGGRVKTGSDRFDISCGDTSPDALTHYTADPAASTCHECRTRAGLRSNIVGVDLSFDPPAAPSPDPE